MNKIFIGSPRVVSFVGFDEKIAKKQDGMPCPLERFKEVLAFFVFGETITEIAEIGPAHYGLSSLKLEVWVESTTKMLVSTTG